MGARVILHADDFGLNRGVTDGIIRGFERGLLTSTALLANAPDAGRAVQVWKQLGSLQALDALPSSGPRRELGDPRRSFDLGVHLNLTQGRPLTADRFPEELLDPRGFFPGIVRVFARLQRQPTRFQAALRAELAAQIQFLVDHGLQPTHLNGHQYVEMISQVACLLPELLQQFRIDTVRVAMEPGLFRTVLCHDRRPAAWFLAVVKRQFARRFKSAIAPTGAAHPESYFGTAHAGRIDRSLVERFLTRASKDGMTEIAFHPAAADQAEGANNADGWHDPLAAARVAELELLESPALHGMLMVKPLRLGRLAQLKAA